MGTWVIATPSFMTQGNFQITENPLDWAIAGKTMAGENAYFQVTQTDGTIAYTRAGAWDVDADGQIVNHDGLLLEPAMIIPREATSIQLSRDGVVSVKMPGQTELQEVGQLELARFINPAGLRAEGDRLFVETEASGLPILAQPGTDGMPEVQQAHDVAAVSAAARCGGDGGTDPSWPGAGPPRSGGAAGLRRRPAAVTAVVTAIVKELRCTYPDTVLMWAPRLTAPRARGARPGRSASIAPQ